MPRKKLTPAAKPAAKPATPAKVTAPPSQPSGTEGWGSAKRGVSHYYRNGAALCRQVNLYVGPLDPDTDHDGPEDCPKCKHRLDAIGRPA